jgi:adenine phosphoribosyltransferase
LASSHEGLSSAPRCLRAREGFIPIRKRANCPQESNRRYVLEYGTDRIEIHKDALKKGERVLLVDDLLATGGTAIAAAALIEKLGAVVVEMAFIVDLPDVGGKKKLLDKGYNIFALTEFEGD